MLIALVAPAPDPPIIGGAENLHDSLLEYLNSEAGHVAELIRIPVRETSLPDLVAGYEAFARLDLSRFDAVISTKYPAWMVSHPNHVVYMLHCCRGFYDWYPEAEAGGREYRGAHAGIRALLAFIAARSGEREGLDEFFDRFRELRADPAARPEIERHPGPLGRAIIHYLDGVGLERPAIKRYAAIAGAVVRRPDYFPKGAKVAVLHPPTGKRGFHDAGEEYFFTASRFYSSKRIELLIDAFRQTDIPISFKLAGTGSEEAKLRRHAGDDKRIEFMGFVEDQQLVELYSRAMAVAFAPQDEDYGYITLEAQLAGKPVITTHDSGGPMELVRDGVTGVVADPNPASLAAAFRRVYGEREWARQLGERARLQAQRVSWDHVVPRLLADAPTDRTRLPRGKARARVTVLNAYSVHPPNHGGRYRMHWIYRTLARHVDVDLVTLALEEEGSETLWISEGFREIRIARSAAHAAADLAAHEQCGVAVYDITALEHMHLTPEYGAALRASLARASAVVLAHPYMTQALRDTGYAGPVVHESHNFEYALKKRMLPDNEASRRRVELVHEAEGWCCRNAVLITATCEDDIGSLQEHYGVSAEKMMLIPNGTDTRSIVFADGRARRGLRRRLGLDHQGVALFLASGHRPNLEASEYLFALAQAMPEVAIAFVGNAIDAFLHRPLPENIWRVGTVDEEVRNIWLDVADVALNPMLYGGGTNLKLLDYFAAGTPVVSTESGIRGSAVQPGRHALIAPVEGFEAPVREVLAGGPDIDRMAVEARELVETQYDWWSLGDRLHDGMAARQLV